MIPEVPAWVGIVLGGLTGGGLLSAVLIFIATRKRDAQSGIAERFDDASELTKYVDARIEAAVAPLRKELEQVKTESHQMNDAIRARETQLWMWDQKGRLGDLPKLPDPILHRLGLGYFADADWHTEPSPPKEPS